MRLDRAPLLLCAIALAASPARAMDFKLVGSTLVMSGPVVSDELARRTIHQSRNAPA